MLDSWLGLQFTSKVNPQTLIDVLLTVTFRLKNLLVRTVLTIPVAFIAYPCLFTVNILCEQNQISTNLYGDWLKEDRGFVPQGPSSISAVAELVKETTDMGDLGEKFSFLT